MTDEQKLLSLENIVNTATKVAEALNRGSFGEAMLITTESERRSREIVLGDKEVEEK